MCGVLLWNACMGPLLRVYTVCGNALGGLLIDWASSIFERRSLSSAQPFRAYEACWKYYFPYADGAIHHRWIVDWPHAGLLGKPAANRRPGALPSHHLD